MKNDLISRQAAIDFIDAGRLCNPNEPRWSDNEIVNFLKSRPSAQPEPLTVNIDNELTKDECDRLKQVMRDSPILLLPSAQPEIIRCKDCKHRNAENGFCEGRGWPMQLVPDDGFCDKGERRTDE